MKYLILINMSILMITMEQEIISMTLGKEANNLLVDQVRKDTKI
jgi:hypothetical protein